MGIYSIAETSYAGLQIAQAGILTTSQNIAGTTIDGYSRRNANAIMDALAPNSLQASLTTTSRWWCGKRGQARNRT